MSESSPSDDDAKKTAKAAEDAAQRAAYGEAEAHLQVRVVDLEKRTVETVLH
jgi:hypothetical protein